MVFAYFSYVICNIETASFHVPTRDAADGSATRRGKAHFAVASAAATLRATTTNQSFSILPTRMPFTSQCPRTRASFMSEKEWVPTALLSTSIHRHSK